VSLEVMDKAPSGWRPYAERQCQCLQHFLSFEADGEELEELNEGPRRVLECKGPGREATWSTCVSGLPVSTVPTSPLYSAWSSCLGRGGGGHPALPGTSPCVCKSP
jgi:hypothetical protein